MNKIYIFLILSLVLNKIKLMREPIYTRPAEQTDAAYILRAHADIDTQVGYSPDTLHAPQQMIEKQIANPDHRQYIIAMAGSAIVGSALLVETPIPPVNKRGQYIDMINVSEGLRSPEIEQRLLAHAAQIAIINAPSHTADNSFLRIDSLSRTNNVSTSSLRVCGAELADIAYGNNFHSFYHQ